MHGRARVATVIGIALILVVGGAGAATFRVTTSADTTDPNPGDGICGTLFSCSLRQAVQESNALPGRDRIDVPEGTYNLSRIGAGEDGALTGDLDVLDDLVIVGAGAGASTVNAGGRDRVFHVLASRRIEVLIEGVTITGGRALGEPATFGDLGGGVLVEEGNSVSLSHCTLSGNLAERGAGLALLWQAEVRVRHSSLTGNTAFGRAPAAWGIYADLSLVASTVSDNRCAGDNCQTTIGMENARTLLISNSTITSNPAGGVYSQNTDATVVHSTITDNNGSGIHFFSYSGAQSLTLTNSILAGNYPGDCYFSFHGATYSHAGNLAGDRTCGLDPKAGELPETDPMLRPLASNGGPTLTRLPHGHSPIVDAAAGQPVCLAVDQRGVERPQGAACDIGATEGTD